MANRDQIKGMADLLISTLKTTMPTEEADAIVRSVALELYRDVLGIPGKIVPKSYGIAHGAFGKNGRRQAIQFAEYEFKPQEVAPNDRD